MGEKMSDEEIGVVQLHDRAKLVFSLNYWKGKPYAHVRKFIHSNKYEGPTKAGLSMDEGELIDVLDALQRLHQETPKSDDYEFSRVGKYEGTDIIISIIRPDDPMSLPSVDIREFVQTPKYTGPTKKGIRFSWDKLSDVVAFFHIQAKRLEKSDGPQVQLFPKSRPESGKQVEKIGEGGSNEHKSSLAQICPNGFRQFPDDFVKKLPKEGQQFILPAEAINVDTQIDGTCVVKSDFGFCCTVRNPIEGKFIVYCSLRGHRTIRIPEAMIETFKAVKEYENYLREIGRLLIQEYERKSGNRTMAEYQTKEVFKKHGLPWISHS